MAKKRWSDLSYGQKVAVVILGTVQVGLLVAALWDLAHRSADEVRGDRRMWAGLVFINWFGPLAYFTIGRRCGPCCAP
jgi:bacteriorhodopsin